MRIAIVIGSSDFFGAERRLLRIAKALDARDDVEVVLAINSTLYVKSSSSPLADSIIGAFRERRQLVVLPDQLSHLKYFTGKAAALSVLFGVKYSVHTILRGRLLAYVRALFGLPSVIEVTSSDIAKRIATEVPPFVLSRVTKYVCVSPTVCKTLEKAALDRRVALRSEQLITAKSGYYEPSDTQEQPKERLLVSASRFIPRKNVGLLAEAISIAAPKLRDWKFDILGQGEEEDRIRGALGDLITSGRAFVGYTSDVGLRLARSSIYVSLIEPDNYPSQSVLEAMSMGNALLLSNTGETVERFLSGGENGRSVERGTTPSQLAEVLVGMCSDFDSVKAWGQRSQEIVSTRYSAENFVSEMLQYHETSKR